MRQILAFVSLLIGSAARLYAQEPSAAVDSSLAADSTPYRLPEVEATATRTTRDLFMTPLAVTTVARDRLEGVRGVGLDEALAAVPGVLAQSRAGGTDVRLVIRGYGARGAGDRSNSGTSRGIRVLVDGIPETEPDGRTAFDGIDLAASEGIEVIRSNATSLWGNASGGVVSVSTFPSYRGRFLAAQSMAGAFGLRRAALRTGTSLGRGQVYLSATGTTGDGWRTNSAHRRLLVTSGYAGPLGPRTDLRVLFTGVRNKFEIPGPLGADELALHPEQANSLYALRHERRSNLVGRLGVMVVHRPDLLTEVSATGFLNPKALERSERGTFRRFDRLHRGGSLVARRVLYAGPSVATSMLAGIDVATLSGPGEFYSLDADGGQGPDLVAHRSEGSRNLGFFAEQILYLGERLTLSAGARYDAITYDYRDYLDPHLNARKVFNRITPKVAANLLLSPRRSMYAAIGGGLEAPAGNETDPPNTFGEDTLTAINPLLEPIRSTTYEIGTKHQIVMGGSLLRYLLYDIAMYYTNVDHEPVPYEGGDFYLTAGRVRRAGVEVGVRAEAAELSVEAAFTYGDNRYLEYQVDSVHYGAPGRVADYGGNRAVGVPEVIYSGTIGYAPKFLGPLRFAVSVLGSGRYFADDANLVHVPAHTMVNGTVSFERPVVLKGGIGLRGFVTVNNLLNRHYIASAFLNPLQVGGRPVAYEPGLPRNVVISLSLDWLRASHP